MTLPTLTIPITAPCPIAADVALALTVPAQLSPQTHFALTATAACNVNILTAAAGSKLPGPGSGGDPRDEIIARHCEVGERESDARFMAKGSCHAEEALPCAAIPGAIGGSISQVRTRKLGQHTSASDPTSDKAEAHNLEADKMHLGAPQLGTEAPVTEFAHESHTACADGGEERRSVLQRG